MLKLFTGSIMDGGQMIEPVFLIGAIFIAFFAGGVGGYYLGRRDARITNLYESMKRRHYNAQSKIDRL